jgi:biopolymer transport protein ExbD
MGKRPRDSGEGIELNLTAMLDMAFQILAFFVLTFRPVKAEGQIAVRMPPVASVPGDRTEHMGDTDDPAHLPQELRTVVIIVTATEHGDLRQLYLSRPRDKQREAVAVDAKLKVFGMKLAALLNDPASPFDQVVIQVGSKLRYAELMKVIDVCTRQTLGGDPHQRLSKLSVVDENG